MKGMGHGLQTLPSLPLPCTWPAGSRQGWSMLGRVAPSLSTQPGHLCGRGCPPGLLEHVRGFSRWAFSWPFPRRQVRLQLERVFSPASLHHSNPGWDPWRKLMFRQLLSCLHTHVIQSPFYIKWSKRSCPSDTTTPGHLSSAIFSISRWHQTTSGKPVDRRQNGGWDQVGHIHSLPFITLTFLSFASWMNEHVIKSSV